VEFVNWDGTIISSAQYPGRVGYKNDWVTARKDWRGTPAFLKREELPDGVALAVTAVRTVSGGNDKSLYIIGGWRLDQNFLAALVLPAGMRALLYRNLEPAFVSAALTDVNGTTDEPERLRPLIEQVQRNLKRRSRRLTGKRMQLQRKLSMRCRCSAETMTCSRCSWWAVRAKNWYC